MNIVLLLFCLTLASCAFPSGRADGDDRCEMVIAIWSKVDCPPTLPSHTPSVR